MAAIPPRYPLPRRSPLAIAALAGSLAFFTAAASQAQRPERPVPVHTTGIEFVPVDDADPSYPKLDNVEGDFVHVVTWPVRPMTFAPDGSGLWAVNVHGNTINLFDGTFQRIRSERTLWNPVSIGTYVSPTDGPNSDQLLVVCHGSNALVFHNRQTGEIFDIVTLPPQPADLLISAADDVAFVSTLGQDAVVEVDLVTRQIVRRFEIPSRLPTYLSQTAAGEVLVAPRWSGNNSVVDRQPPIQGSDHSTQAGPSSVLDLDDPTIATQGLPDEDLFWLDRTSGQAIAVARGMGTLLFGGGVHPTTQRFWQLNTEALNKDPLRQTEPAIVGDFSRNRLTQITLPVLGSGTVVTPAPGDIRDLDLANPSGTYDPATSVGSPYALTFSSTGFGLVAGLLTDNVTILGANGAWVAEWDLPDGCIPRQVLLDASEQFALTYCSGTNTVELDSLGVWPPATVATLDLGFDPTPEPIQRGRRLFFDASRSLRNNLSCATCHDEGRQDLVAWNLSNGEIDDKGPMVTQTLVGIDRSRHHHWRGEQLDDLLDFNGAFPALLGGAPLGTGPGSDFEDFEAFIFSLQHPANPFQNPLRILDDSIEPPLLLPARQQADSSAIAGRQVYLDACEHCHHLPGGTSNDVIPDGVVFREPKPKRQWLQVAHLWDVANKGQQDDVTVTFAGGATQLYPRMGFGLAHSGNPRNIAHFLDFFNLTDQQMSDGTNFLYQFDSGVAPSIHGHQLMQPANVLAAQAMVIGTMIPQAQLRHSDLAVFGRPNPASSRVRGWVFDRASGRFLRDDGLLQPLSFFTTQATAGSTFAFVGQPVGQGRLFAVDFDRDGLLNALEKRTPTDGRFLVDFDGDGDWDGHEAQNGGDPLDPTVQSNDVTPPSLVGGPPAPLWQTSKVGRFNFETDELATWTLRLTPAVVSTASPILDFAGTEPRLTHSAIVHDLFPGLPYTGQLTITDQGGLVQTASVAITPRGFTDGPDTVIATDLGWTGPIAVSASSLAATATVRVSRKANPLAHLADYRVIARVLIDGVPATSSQLAGATGFCVNQVPYIPLVHGAPVLGPFLVSTPTGAGGTTTIPVQLSGLVSGQEITLGLEAISPNDPSGACSLTGEPSVTSPVVQNLPASWSFPDTERPFRAIGLTFP